MKKVLIMEDEVNIRSFVVINLKRAGYDVLEAATGQQALDQIQMHPDIGVAILDIMLPDIDGFEVCRRIRANNKQMGFGKTKAKKAHEERPDVKFDDVAGVDEAVEEMQEIKDFLANPSKYQSLGAKIPRGCLLVGPPCTG